MRTWLLLLGLVGAAACDDPVEETDAVDTDPVPPAPTGTPDDTDPVVPVDPECAALEGGDLVLEIDGVERRILVHRPAEPSGAALLFFHGRGQTPEVVTSRVGLADLAETHGTLVFAPAELGDQETTWVLEVDSPDVHLFDRLLDCAVGAGADPARLHAAGYSIGGLFVDYVLQHRSDRLASVLTSSGGIHQGYTAWQAPAVDVPVLLAWGGPGDVNNMGIEFDPLNLELAALLREAGHLVVECIHDEGHTIPDELGGVLALWTTHVAGEPSPWATSTAGLPPICTSGR